MGVQAIPIPIEVVSHSLPFQFPNLIVFYSHFHGIPIPMHISVTRSVLSPAHVTSSSVLLAAMCCYWLSPVHTTDANATQLDSCVASALAVCIGHYV